MMDQPPPALSLSAVDTCYDHLLRAIVSGRLAVGHRLPPERSLAAQLSVNRTTLRSALTRLDAAGLIVARQGSGTVVRDFRHAAGPELVPELLRHASNLDDRRRQVDDLLLMRRQMSAAVLARLAAGVTPRARLHVAAAVETLAMAIAQGADLGRIAEADLAVFAAVLDAVDSPVLALCLNPLNDVVRRSAPLRAAMYAHPQRHVQGWLELCDWLAAPDGAAIGWLLAAIDERDAATLAALNAGEP